MARKPYDWRADLDKIEELAAHGLQDQEIFAYLGISSATFYSYKSRKKEFSEAIKRGRAKFHLALRKKLNNAATRRRRPSLTAAMFLLKTQYGYREAGPYQAEQYDDQDAGTITYVGKDGRRQ